MAEGSISAASAARDLLVSQRHAFVAEGPVSVETRRARLQAVIDLLIAHADELTTAMGKDFGGRAEVYS
ncbi:MAG TPA: hypothetical protein VFQ88_12330, partial [Nevskiaceae bacterium]|nr:hypothetical protein [Nevskiaceae bacterium]